MLSDNELVLVVTGIELLYKQLAQATDQCLKRVKRRTDDTEDIRTLTLTEVGFCGYY